MARSDVAKTGGVTTKIRMRQTQIAFVQQNGLNLPTNSYSHACASKDAPTSESQVLCFALDNSGGLYAKVKRPRWVCRWQGLINQITLLIFRAEVPQYQTCLHSSTIYTFTPEYQYTFLHRFFSFAAHSWSSMIPPTYQVQNEWAQHVIADLDCQGDWEIHLFIFPPCPTYQWLNHLVNIPTYSHYRKPMFINQTY